MVLGPLLFLLYVNDIFDSINSDLTFCHLYADDTVIIQSAKDPMTLKSSLERQLVGLSKWFFDNKLSVNTDKTEVIFFGKASRVKECKGMPSIVFQDSEIKPKSEVKYLGVVFDEGLTWEKHASNVRKKVYLTLNKIKRISTLIDVDTKRKLINALVYPHMGYCVNAWSNTLSRVRNRFESLTRQIDRVSPMNRPFDSLAKYNTAVMTFKAVNKICPQYLSERFKLVKDLHDHDTRFSAQNKLVVQNNRNRFEGKTFLANATKVWNELPTELRMEKSLLSFKTKAKNHFYG